MTEAGTTGQQVPAEDHKSDKEVPYRDNDLEQRVGGGEV